MIFIPSSHGIACVAWIHAVDYYFWCDCRKRQKMLLPKLTCSFGKCTALTHDFSLALLLVSLLFSGEIVQAVSLSSRVFCCWPNVANINLPNNVWSVASHNACCSLLQLSFPSAFVSCLCFFRVNHTSDFVSGFGFVSSFDLIEIWSDTIEVWFDLMWSRLDLIWCHRGLIWWY